jgi:hypothetical protein
MPGDWSPKTVAIRQPWARRPTHEARSALFFWPDHNFFGTNCKKGRQNSDILPYFLPDTPLASDSFGAPWFVPKRPLWMELTMPDLTALFICQDSTLIRAMRSIVDALEDLQLKTCATLDEAHAVLEVEEPALVVVHLARGIDEQGVIEFLHTVNSLDRTCPSLLLCDEYQNEQAVTFLQAGATEY